MVFDGVFKLGLGWIRESSVERFRLEMLSERWVIALDEEVKRVSL